MPNTKVKTTKTKKPSSKITKFIRVPIDEKTEALIKQILEENPLFSQLDAIKFIIGKQILDVARANRYKAKAELVEFLKSLESRRQGPTLTEDEEFAILKENGLM